jgi:sugar/nucleoside kinase (ribokinase family)
VVFDCADPFAVSRNREAFLRLIREHAGIVFANSEEARILFDNYDPGECAKSLGKLTPRGAVKDGARGSYVCEEGRITHVPVTSKEALDSTGAGDTYAAGFLLGISAGMATCQAGELASLLAGEVIMQHGAQLEREKIGKLESPLLARFSGR